MGLTLIPILLLAGGALLVAAGVRTRRGAGTLPEHWIRTTGTVVDASRPQRVMFVTPDGRRVQLRGTLDPSFVVGQSVEVLVDPVDPTRARLVEADRSAFRVARSMLALGVLLLVLGAAAVVVFG